MKINYVTGNSFKFSVAQKRLMDVDVELIQTDIETPEIQSTDVEEVAAYSAKFASEALNEAVVVTDTGYYFEALQGFPGPFIKYVNQWFSPEDFLRLMQSKENRKVTVRACLAYCQPNNDPKTFISEVSGTISDKAVKSSEKNTTSINEIFIPEGYSKVESELSNEERIEFWSKMESHWSKLAKYLSSQF